MAGSASEDGPPKGLIYGEYLMVRRNFNLYIYFYIYRFVFFLFLITYFVLINMFIARQITRLSRTCDEEGDWRSSRWASIHHHSPRWVQGQQICTLQRKGFLSQIWYQLIKKTHLVPIFFSIWALVQADPRGIGFYPTFVWCRSSWRGQHASYHSEAQPDCSYSQGDLDFSKMCWIIELLCHFVSWSLSFMHLNSCHATAAGRAGVHPWDDDSAWFYRVQELPRTSVRLPKSAIPSAREHARS